MEPLGQPDKLPAAPPTQPGPVPIARPQSKWPTVLGIIAIVLAAFALIGLLGQAVMKILQIPTGTSSAPAVEPPFAWTVIATPLLAVLAVLNLAGGVGLLKRRRWSVPTLITWAIGNLLLAIVNMIASMLVMPAALEQMRRQGTAGPAMGPNMFEMVLVAGMCFGLVWGLTPPVFVLIWFRRPVIKAETATWR